MKAMARVAFPETDFSSLSLSPSIPTAAGMVPSQATTTTDNNPATAPTPAKTSAKTAHKNPAKKKTTSK
jgi:hypothetical protein